jgi:hypothetical protein
MRPSSSAVCPVVVGVKVRVDHAGDVELLSLGVGEVLGDVAPRVHDHRSARGPVAIR